MTRSRLRELSDRHGFRPNRALGQNFVVDPNTVRRIARLASVGPGDHVVEIGAGVGALTLALVETGATVTAIETDRHLVPALAEMIEGTDVRLVVADARDLDWADGLHRPSVLVANLPYNVATPLVLDILDDVPEIERMLVMVQREAAERLAAQPGAAAFGLPSLKVAQWAEAEIVGSVTPEVFSPRPKVQSSLLELRRRVEPRLTDHVEETFALARAGFGQRRKMLRRSLAGLVTAGAFERAGVDPQARPETIDLDDWHRLASS
ncbi:MAG: 16S rRNA (adenine(1518)-N(6)/adenine(1519)-N(6))-dimethyltransferase RsmA [Actinomycetota bacterium]